MACDHYVSICKPLLYTVTMSPQVCSLLMSSSYVMGFAGGVVHTGCMIRLIFCDSNIINHYLCDIFHLLQLSCGSTYANELVVSVVVGTVVMVSSFTISVSYTFFSISFTYHQIKVGPKPSAPWLHIITASLFYRLGLLIHVKPSFAGSVGQGKFFSVFYANVVPMLNPLIYSLRNKDVKIALKKTMKRITNWAEPFIPPFLSFPSLPAPLYLLPTIRFFSSFVFLNSSWQDFFSNFFFLFLPHDVTPWAYSWTRWSFSALSNPTQVGDNGPITFPI